MGLKSGSRDAQMDQGLTAIVGADVLEQTVATLSAIADEAVLEFGDGGVSVAVVDPANVAMTRLDLDARAFESYDAAGTRVGVDLTRLSDAIGYADSGDLVHLDLDTETRKLTVRLRNIELELALIDPDAVRDEPEIPDVGEKLTTEATLDAAALQEAVDVMSFGGDHVSIRSEKQTPAVHLESDGDLDASDVTFGRDELATFSIAEDASTLVSLDYLDDVTGVIPDGEVTLHHGGEFPIFVEYAYADEAGQVEAMIAPRIQEDG